MISGPIIQQLYSKYQKQWASLKAALKNDSLQDLSTLSDGSH